MSARPRLTQQQVNRIFELRKTGKSGLVIAGLVGVSGDTVKRYLRKGCRCLGMANTHTTKCPNWGRINVNS